MALESWPGIKDRRDQAAFYLNLSRTGGDIVTYRLDGKAAFLINHPRHVAHVLKDNAHNYDNPYHPYAELATYYAPPGCLLLRLRKNTTDLNGARTEMVTELSGAGREAAESWVSLSDQGTIEVDLETKRLLFRLDNRLLFGIEAGDLSTRFIQAVNLIEECWANQLFTGQDDHSAGLQSYYQEAIRVQDTVADEIAFRSGMLPVGTVVPPALRTAIVRTLLNSYNASATALCWTLYLIAAHPEAQDRLDREIQTNLKGVAPTFQDTGRLSYLRMVIMESLRLYPPAWILGRRARVVDRIEDVVIPPHSPISISPYTLHRQTAHWERPNLFWPDRFAAEHRTQRPEFAYFPFGGGKRSCPAGYRVIGQLQVLLAAILRTCRIELCDNGVIRPRGLVALRPQPGVRARFILRTG